MSSILHIKSHFCNTPRDLYIITQKTKINTEKQITLSALSCQQIIFLRKNQLIKANPF